MASWIPLKSLSKTAILLAIAAVVSYGTSAAAQLATNAWGPLVGVERNEGNKSVFVFIHGDVSGGGGADYHYKYAMRFVDKDKGHSAIGLLRPGYYDNSYRQSPGDNNNRIDQYTQENADLIAETLKSIKEQYGDPNFVVLGHSGGAAQLGVVIGQNPGLVDTAILLACPCHLENWKKRHPNGKISKNGLKNSLSPSDYVDGLTPETKIIAISGDQDNNTFPEMARDYVAAAKERGINAEYILVKGGDHNGNEALQNAFFAAIETAMNN